MFVLCEQIVNREKCLTLKVRSGGCVGDIYEWPATWQASQKSGKTEQETHVAADGGRGWEISHKQGQPETTRQKGAMHSFRPS